ncbi:MAG: class I SAM-dependent methyltransferase [Gammaproteobacteria bacterium]|nr:class I SAM-dependent methyltransferase [Gammaproteobacteria bacterium]
MRTKLSIYQKFLDGVPVYLARHYWWAYLWRPAVWFFDHQFIINLILFGQYRKLMTAAMAHIDKTPKGEMLQLTCVYGSLTPSIVNKIRPNVLHIADVSPAQLENVRAKIKNKNNILMTRLNAESLAYRDNSFSTIIVFFLLHELPQEARTRALAECMRVLDHDGVLICAGYNALPAKHFLYRFPVTRFILTKLEPFLASLWKFDILSALNELGRPFHKRAESIAKTEVFSSFYHVTTYQISGDR